MAKTTKKKKLNLHQTLDNPWIISILLACAGVCLVLLISVILNWPKWIASQSTAGPTTIYTLKDNFEEQINNNGSLTTKTTISPKILNGPIISPDDPSRGAEQPLIYIVYFGDFACTFCQEQEQIFEQALNTYPEQIKIIWKDLPEKDTSSLSYQAAKAGRCAFLQDRFWEYHDTLLAGTSLQPTDLEITAVKAGLDVNLFRQCLQEVNGLADNLINKNWQEADALGISATPYIYVNNRDFLGKLTWEELKTVIDYELAQSNNDLNQ